jgi:hypothetical protein
MLAKHASKATDRLHAIILTALFLRSRGKAVLLRNVSTAENCVRANKSMSNVSAVRTNLPLRIKSLAPPHFPVRLPHRSEFKKHLQRTQLLSSQGLLSVAVAPLKTANAAFLGELRPKPRRILRLRWILEPRPLPKPTTNSQGRKTVGSRGSSPRHLCRPTLYLGSQGSALFSPNHPSARESTVSPFATLDFIPALSTIHLLTTVPIIALMNIPAIYLVPIPIKIKFILPLNGRSPSLGLSPKPPVGNRLKQARPVSQIDMLPLPVAV